MTVERNLCGLAVFIDACLIGLSLAIVLLGTDIAGSKQRRAYMTAMIAA